MFLAGTIQNLQTTGDTVVLNFSSLNAKYPRMPLYPPYELGARSDYEFDMKYANWLMTEGFVDFMQVPYNIYLGHDVFVLISDMEELEMITESFFKFIQQRYGLNVTYISCQEDFLRAGECQFSELGSLNFQHDKERLALMLEKLRLQQGSGRVGF